MSVDVLVALMGFAFAMSVTPGPGNFLLLSSGVNFGFMRTLPTVLGISGGFMVMLFAVGLGLGQVLKAHESVYTILRIACAAYVLWLAWKIANMASLGTAAEDAAARRVSFLEAALLVWLNPKAWAVALIVTVTYTRPEDYVASLVALIAVFAVANLPAISLWAIGGVALRRLLAVPARVRAFNIAMALLLVASMAPVLLGAVG